MMLGARTGAWAKSGAPLPYDAEVEWFEPIDPRIIKAGYYRINAFLLSQSFGNDTGMEVEIARLINNTDDVAAIGSRDSSGGNNRYFMGGTVNRLWYFGYGKRIDYGNCVVGQKVKLSLNMFNSREARFNGELAGTFAYFAGNSMPFAFPGYNTGTASYILLYGPSSVSNGSGRNMYRYYGLKVTKGNTLTHDLIPVRVGANLKLFNKVNSTIINEMLPVETYGFNIGPDKQTITA